MILIILDGKKVTVEVDSTKSDPFFFDPLWENYEAVVEEVDYEIPSEDGAGEEEEEDIEEDVPK